MGDNIAEYYDNNRPTKFNDSIKSSTDDKTLLSLNAIYEYEGRSARLYMGSYLQDDIDGYVRENSPISTLGVTAYSSVNNKWTKRDNFYFYKLFDISLNSNQNGIFSMVFNAYKNNQYYNKNFEGGYWITSKDPADPSSTMDPSSTRDQEAYLHLGGTGPPDNTTTDITSSTGSDSDKIVSINGTYSSLAEEHFTSEQRSYNHQCSIQVISPDYTTDVHKIGFQFLDDMDSNNNSRSKVSSHNISFNEGDSVYFFFRDDTTYNDFYYDIGIYSTVWDAIIDERAGFI